MGILEKSKEKIVIDHINFRANAHLSLYDNDPNNTIDKIANNLIKVLNDYWKEYMKEDPPEISDVIMRKIKKILIIKKYRDIIITDTVEYCRKNSSFSDMDIPKVRFFLDSILYDNDVNIKSKEMDNELYEKILNLNTDNLSNKNKEYLLTKFYYQDIYSSSDSVINDNWEKFGNNIIIESAKEFRCTGDKLKREEILKFFRSDDFCIYSNLDGNELARVLENKY